MPVLNELFWPKKTSQPEKKVTTRAAFRNALVVLLVLGVGTGCTTLRGRADDALAARDYQKAAQLYGRILAENPDDEEAKKQLTRAERGMLDDALDTVAREQQQGHTTEAMNAGLKVLQISDRVHPGTIDEPRKQRIAQTVELASSTLRSSIGADATVGRALAARAKREAAADWLARPELGGLGGELDTAIAESGARTCAKATRQAGDAPFTLELVATYCKSFGATMPPWKPRPLVVGAFDIAGSIVGMPAGEQLALQQSLESGAQRSVWFSPASQTHATIEVQGSVSARFTRTPTELTKGWTESVPYQDVETYQAPVRRRYQDTETYTETVPYTAYENGKRTTRYRTVTRTRPVTRYRTDWVTRTRPVTRYRDEARIFRYTATKHEASYHASSVMRVTLGPNLPVVTARDAKESSAYGFEHDSEFAPAGVHPEQPSLLSATAWRAQQRERMALALTRSLDATWIESFCSESITMLEDAARCAHGRPRPMPAAVRLRITELFEDDASLVLALPRPKEGV